MPLPFRSPFLFSLISVYVSVASVFFIWFVSWISRSAPIYFVSRFHLPLSSPFLSFYYDFSASVAALLPCSVYSLWDWSKCGVVVGKLDKENSCSIGEASVYTILGCSLWIRVLVVQQMTSWQPTTLLFVFLCVVLQYFFPIRILCL